MLISSLHNDDLLICMPQNNNNNKITNSLKKEIHIFEFCGLWIKKTYHTLKGWDLLWNCSHRNPSLWNWNHNWKHKCLKAIIVTTNERWNIYYNRFVNI